MAKENNPKRKSTRHFDLEKKPVKRHFDLEKDTEDVVSAPQTTVQTETKQKAAPVHNEPQQEPQKKGGKSLLWIVLLVIVIGIVCFFAFKGCNKPATSTDEDSVATPTEQIATESGDDLSPEETTADVAESPEADAEVSDAPATTADDATAPGAPAVDNAQSATSTPAATPAPATNAATGSVDQMANDVIYGKYGVGMERKQALGSDYRNVQNRVNEIYRQAGR